MAFALIEKLIHSPILPIAGSFPDPKPILPLIQSDVTDLVSVRAEEMPQSQRGLLGRITRVVTRYITNGENNIVLIDV